MFKNLSLKTIFVLLSCVIGQNVWAGCYSTRHIYNDSNSVWIMEKPEKNGWNSMCFSMSDDDNCIASFPFKIPARSTVTIYNSMDDNNQALPYGFQLRDSAGTAKTFWMNRMCEIRHSGSTGGASLNDPADGDIRIGSPTW